MSFHKRRLSSTLLLLLGAINCAAETVYHWRDEAGNSHFSDTPPATQLPVSEVALSLPTPSMWWRR